MAATLLDIKSRMLLPKIQTEEVETEDPRAELIQQLLEYKMYKCMAYELRDLQVDAQKVLFKVPTIPPIIDKTTVIASFTKNILVNPPPVTIADITASVR